MDGNNPLRLSTSKAPQKMTRGRKPKPTAVKDASGAHRKNPKRRNNEEPRPPEGRPSCPDWIKTDKTAKAHWDWLCDTLDEMNILSKADFAVVALTANTYARWRELDKVVKNGNVSAASGRTSTPQAQNVHKYAERYIKLISELGLTPSSRSRIKVAKKDEGESGFSELLSRFGTSVN